MMLYLPPRPPAAWEYPPPEAPGLDPAAVAAAARYAAERETPWGRDLSQVVERDFGEAPPWNEALGPVRPRGGPNGLVLRHARIVAEWGDPGKIAPPFTVPKRSLPILAGPPVPRVPIPT